MGRNRIFLEDVVRNGQICLYLAETRLSCVLPQDRTTYVNTSVCQGTNMCQDTNTNRVWATQGFLSTFRWDTERVGQCHQ